VEFCVGELAGGTGLFVGGDDPDDHDVFLRGAPRAAAAWVKDGDPVAAVWPEWRLGATWAGSRVRFSPLHDARHRRLRLVDHAQVTEK
jgi:hypothetical protein